MTAFVALLRGVNVGKANRVPMAELRTLLRDLGYEGISTLLNSGNAVFQAQRGTPADHASAISCALSARLALDIPVIVKSAEEFAAIVEENPLAEAGRDPSCLLVAFVQDASLLPPLARIGALLTPSEQFQMGRTAAYLYCADGILKSKAGEAMLRKAGRDVTTRNWATALKLCALATELGWVAFNPASIEHPTQETP